MAPAKRLKRTGSKATIDHVSGSTGRDGAFDFASKAETLERMTGQTMTGGANRKAEGFKQNQSCAHNWLPALRKQACGCPMKICLTAGANWRTKPNN